MIECKICGKKMKFINNIHLSKLHGVTSAEYLAMFPGSVLTNIYMRKPRRERPICQKPGCTSRVSSTHNKYCSYKCSMSHRMSKDGRNEQGGHRNPAATDLWYSLAKRRKREAKERDQYTCQRCGIHAKGKKLQAHHIIPGRCFSLPQEAHDLENLVTLCDKCHHIVEWDMIKELFKRSKQLDEMLFGFDGWIPVEEFCHSIAKNPPKREVRYG